MFNYVDYIILGLCFLSAWAGYVRGILRTLSGPIAFILSLIIAFLYFQETKNLWIALVISVFAPILIRFIFIMTLRIWNISFGKNKPSTFSSWLGATFSLIWRATWLSFALLFIINAPIPGQIQFIQQTKLRVAESMSYQALTQWILPHFEDNNTTGLFDLLNVLDNKENHSEVRKLPEYQAVMKNKKFQALSHDTTLKQQIEDKKIFEVMRNPRIIELLKDKELTEQIIRLNQKTKSFPKEK